jgi:signal peptidase I
MDPPPRSGEEPTYHRVPKPITSLGAVAAVAGVGYAVLRWRPSRVQIEGPSMEPTLAPGDWALTVSGSRFGKGDVVIVEHPGRPGYEMVKRVTAVPGDRVGERPLGGDEFWVEGDREDASTDSRHFGPVRQEHLKAKVLLIYWPKERRRLL